MTDPGQQPSLEPRGRFPRINFILGTDYAGFLGDLALAQALEDLLTLHLDIQITATIAQDLRRLLAESPVNLDEVLKVLEPPLRGRTKDAKRCQKFVKAAFKKLGGSQKTASLQQMGRWPRVNYVVMEDYQDEMSSNDLDGGVEYLFRLHLDIPLPSGTADELRKHLKDDEANRSRPSGSSRRFWTTARWRENEAAIWSTLHSSTSADTGLDPMPTEYLILRTNVGVDKDIDLSRPNAWLLELAGWRNLTIISRTDVSAMPGNCARTRRTSR